MERQETLNALREFYIPERLEEVDPDFLEFEEEMSSLEDLQQILECKEAGVYGWTNDHNSIIWYLVGCSDQFDTVKGRSDTIDGSPPDIDIDFEALERHRVFNLVEENWGVENVARIGTFQKFKPRGMADDWHRIHEADRGYVKDLKKLIPDDHAGKAAKIKDIVDAVPDFQERYPDFYKAASHLEGMIAKDGIHAAGVVISDFPVTDIIPTRTKTDSIDKYHKKKIKKRVTQMDMHEVEELGLIKFDFLSIENLDIIKETCRLIEEERGVTVDPYQIPDGDVKTYRLLHAGMVAGIFQMETSGSAKDLILRIEPTSIEELSDISALNRPGPMQAGLHDAYVMNKKNGYAPLDLPAPVAEVLKTSYWTLVYQEQVMKLATDLAGFTLQEADDVRRAMGKKKKEVLNKWKVRFIDGCVNHGGLERQYAEELWVTLAGDDTGRSAGFADYCLAGDTLIRTREDVSNTTRTIKDIVDNNYTLDVHSIDQEGYLTFDNRVSQFHNNGEQECYTYTLEDGSTVTCTPDHMFLTTDHKWISADDAYKQSAELVKLD